MPKWIGSMVFDIYYRYICGLVARTYFVAWHVEITWISDFRIVTWRDLQGHRIIIDTIPYDTGLEARVRACSLLVVPEVFKRH